MTPDKARALLDGTTPGPWRLQQVKGHPHLRHITTGTGHSGDPTAPVCIPVDVTSREGAANMALKAAAPDMARTIAGMREEWRVEFQAVDDRKWYPLTEWAEGEPDRRPWNVTPTRINRRYVTTPEVTDATD